MNEKLNGLTFEAEFNFLLGLSLDILKEDLPKVQFLLEENGKYYRKAVVQWIRSGEEAKTYVDGKRVPTEPYKLVLKYSAIQDKLHRLFFRLYSAEFLCSNFYSCDPKTKKRIQEICQTELSQLKTKSKSLNSGRKSYATLRIKSFIRMMISQAASTA